MPATREAVLSIIEESKRRAREGDKKEKALTLRLRELGGLIRAAGDLAVTERSKVIEADHIKRALKRARTIEEQIREQQIIAGTPKTVIPKLRRLLEETRPSILGFWASDGFVSNPDTVSCIRLLGQEVLPAVREMGKELGLWSPFEANAPVSITQPAPPAPRNGA